MVLMRIGSIEKSLCGIMQNGNMNYGAYICTYSDSFQPPFGKIFMF
jgi:hypothetical protein